MTGKNDGLLVLAAAVGLFMTPAATVASEGKEIARSICATCHQLPNQQGTPVGPSFTELAARTHYTAEGLKQTLATDQHAEAVPVAELELSALAKYLNDIDH